METWAQPRDPIDMLVGFSNTEAGKLAAATLAKRGHKKVAYVGRKGGRGALRLKGFREMELDVVGELLVDDVIGPSDGRRCLSELLERGTAAEALFCGNDLLALGCIVEARRRRISVPESLAVIGFGDSDIAAEIPPGLTTIGIDNAALGRCAGEMLLARLSGQKMEERIRCSP